VSTTSQATKREFQNRIYLDLDQKLRQTPWNSGASEAHGLLCGLACRGITSDTVRTRAFLFQLTESSHIDMIEGIFCLACRDLDDESFGFNLMLPDIDTPAIEQAESISNWCQGFLQGIYSDNTNTDNLELSSVAEALDDIMQIGHLEFDPDQSDQNLSSLTEIEEFLRVAVQLIYDELKPASSVSSLQPSTTLN
jgi:uncharacterized protein YgfB (UPF0149 family)